MCYQIVLADDYPSFRQCVREILAETEDLEVVAEAGDGLALLDLLCDGSTAPDVPTLILQGDDDQIVPIGAAALASAKLVKNATLKVYAGAPHGLTDTAQKPAQRRPAGVP